MDNTKPTLLERRQRWLPALRNFSIAKFGPGVWQTTMYIEYDREWEAIMSLLDLTYDQLNRYYELMEDEVALDA